MKLNKIILIAIIASSICCKAQKVKREIFKINADSLVANIEKYDSLDIETEGIIVHICSVDGKKMKLKTQGGNTIKIVSMDNSRIFDTSFTGKKVRVQGKVVEQQIGKSYIDKVEKDKLLLCHIDYKPCKDSIWVNKQIESGNRDSISIKTISRLRKRAEKKANGYISILSIFADNIEILK